MLRVVLHRLGLIVYVVKPNSFEATHESKFMALTKEMRGSFTAMEVSHLSSHVVPPFCNSVARGQ